MDQPVLHVLSSASIASDPQSLIRREWLVTNGLGGYASGTVGGVCTRRYHGHLIAALPAPYGRTMMLGRLGEEVHLPGGRDCSLDGQATPEGAWTLGAAGLLREFRLEAGLPIWEYDLHGPVLQRRLVMPYRRNAVCIRYRLLGGQERLRLRIRPSIDFRSHHRLTDRADMSSRYHLDRTRDGIEIRCAGYPALRIRLEAASGTFLPDGGQVRSVFYPLEQDLGYDCLGTVWIPGDFLVDLREGEEAMLAAGVEDRETMEALRGGEVFRAERHRRRRLLEQAAPAARSGLAAHMVLAADQFIITPATRATEFVHACAAGEDLPAIIAGYHWFTDWGRDTLISLEGILLDTGRGAEAASLLRAYARYVRDGLIPNLFPEGDAEGAYHAADATLWCFHALDRYLQITGDRTILPDVFPVLRDIVEHHLRGTRFGIHVDHGDGLLVQGQPGYALTWMDAKVGDSAVTPRDGKAVELNALWYNALRWMGDWARRVLGDDAAEPYTSAADRAQASFNRRFWYPGGGYLYDVVDGRQGDDASLRPNQLLAISLPHPVLAPRYWRPVLDRVVQQLLTPLGLRSLAPGEPEYRPQCRGDLPARDAAYHQGTVWPWLMGPLVDAWLRVHPGQLEGARQLLAGFPPHLSEAGLGTISEAFDGEPPHAPRACIAQAWSVAEVLRCWVKTAPPAAPAGCHLGGTR